MFKQKSDAAAAAPIPPSAPADAVQEARTRARNRLIGAIVLLAVGVIGFPLVFETQPRPVPIDIPIEIPRRDAMPPLVIPSAPATISPRTVAVDPVPLETAPAASVVPARPASAAARPASAASRPSLPVVTTARPPAPRPSDALITEPARDAGRDITPPARPPSAPVRMPGADGERARALLEGRSEAAAEGSRFVVQIGAFADAEAAREVRKQADKLGLKTYTQIAQTASGNRIRVRVGPFASRAEADAALAKAKAAGLNAVVLTL